MKRIVVAPHADDEVLGCASVLGRDAFVYYVGIDIFHVVSREERLVEIDSVARCFGFRYGWNGNTVVNNYKIQDLIPAFENLLNEHEPEELYIPYAESYNQDHRVVWQAMRVATRPHDKNFFVPRIFCYEQPDCLWAQSPFEPNYFKKIEMQRKIEGLSLHKSQDRGHRSVDLIKAMARIRGEQAGVEYAEGFQVLRYV